MISPVKFSLICTICWRSCISLCILPLKEKSNSLKQILSSFWNDTVLNYWGQSLILYVYCFILFFSTGKLNPEVILNHMSEGSYKSRFDLQVEKKKRHVKQVVLSRNMSTVFAKSNFRFSFLLKVSVSRLLSL